MDIKTKYYEVNDVVKYIDLMRQFGDKYYFRGENKDFHKTKLHSSFLRQFSESNEEDVLKFYKKLVGEFYREVGNEITDVERNNFIAFSQHHLLKTNLIDFTTSPLVALYFACVADNYDCDSFGLVYMIQKDMTIDASNEINELFKPENFKLSFFNEYFNELASFGISSKYINILCNLLESMYISGDKYIPYRTNLLEQCKLLTNEQEIKEYVNYIIDGTADKSINLRMSYANQLVIEDFSNIEVLDICTLISLYFEALNKSIHNNNDYNFALPQLPYFIYKTPFKFDRIKSQEGIFIYQNFLSYYSKISEPHNKLLLQNIEPDFTIKINNQKQILKELDILGINRKILFGDYDNTAKYINERFFKTT